MKKYNTSYKVNSLSKSVCQNEARAGAGPVLVLVLRVQAPAPVPGPATNNFTQVRGPLAYWH